MKTWQKLFYANRYYVLVLFSLLAVKSARAESQNYAVNLDNGATGNLSFVQNGDGTGTLSFDYDGRSFSGNVSTGTGGTFLFEGTSSDNYQFNLHSEDGVTVIGIESDPTTTNLNLVTQF